MAAPAKMAVASLALRILIVRTNRIEMIQYDEDVVVYDAMRIIRERVPEVAQVQGSYVCS